jgi:hypothetical protein
MVGNLYIVYQDKEEWRKFEIKIQSDASNDRAIATYGNVE